MHRSNPSQLARGYATAVASAATLATTAIFVRHLTLDYHMPPLALSFWREVFVAASTGALLYLSGLLSRGSRRASGRATATGQTARPDDSSSANLGGFREIAKAPLRVSATDLRYLTAFGLVVAIMNATWTMTVALTGAAVATVLVYSSAAFTAVLGWLFLHERLGLPKLLAVALTITGCALVSGVWGMAARQVNLAGLVVGLLSGLFYAVYSLFGRSASQRGLNPWTTLLFSFGIASLFLLASHFLPPGTLPGANPRAADIFFLGRQASGWLVLLALAAGPTLAGFGLYNVSLSLLPSSTANLIVTMEPAFTAVLAYALLHERLTPTQVVGGLVILSGVLLVRLSESRT